MTDTKKPNRKRKIAKRIWLNEMEERELKRKAKKAGVSQSAASTLKYTGITGGIAAGSGHGVGASVSVIVVNTKTAAAIGNNVHQLAAKANALGFIDAPMLHKEVKEWRAFRVDIVRRFISPDGG